jgi:hypothetical protein
MKLRRPLGYALVLTTARARRYASSNNTVYLLARFVF